MHSKMKHIPIKYHFLQEQVAEKNIRVEYVGTKEQVADIFTKPLPQEAFEYIHQRLGVIYNPKWILFKYLSYMSYIYTRKHHKRTVQLRGVAPDGKIPFPLMTKGEIFIRYRGHRQCSKGRRFIRCKGQRHGSRGSMSDMISLLHQSVVINVKGGDCWLRLVVDDTEISYIVHRIDQY